ncbi:MAG: FAD-dependent oxidoreductase [Deltaproteobacteria bacterium]|nr:FAD-dependent oxidoreductase [Deltaproteobacteria bacterium]
MDRKRIVVVGTSFAGYTGALELKALLGDEHDVTVVANTHTFVFIPSLIWVPFGLREREDISFDVRPVYQKKGVTFLERKVTGFDLERREVLTDGEPVPYDYLLIATGPRVDFASIPGLKPGDTAWSICTMDHALETRAGWERFLNDPGPVVIGATQGAACFGAAYEFVLNVRYQLKRHGLLEKAPLTFVTAEPFLSHFGIGGFGNAKAMCERMFEGYGIRWRVNAEVERVERGAVHLKGGEALPSRFTMLIPRFVGIDAVRGTPGLANAAGFVEVDEGYQHPAHPEVYAAGIAVHVPAPAQTPVACGVPKTGYPSEQMAKTAAHNIAAAIKGGERRALPFGEINALCVLDTGNMGMIIVGDHMLGPRAHELIIPGPQAHWAKVAFEKHFLGTRKLGWV